MDDRTTGIDQGDELTADGESIGRGAQSSGTGATRRGKTTRSAATSGSSSPKNKRASTTDTTLDGETDVRTRELEAEIAETREDLSETVEAIQEKLRPSNIISEGTDAVKTAATQRARDMAETAAQTAYDVVESTRRNPWPALMIGTGVAWLLFDRSGEGRYKNGRYSSGRNSNSGYNDSTGRFSGYRESGYETTARTAGVHTEQRGQWGQDSQYGVSSYEQGTNARSVRNASRRSATALQRMLHENPLLVAAAAVLAGAAIGGALPQTEKENELMGEAREQVVERAQGAAREAADSVRDVASAVQQVAHQVTETGQR